MTSCATLPNSWRVDGIAAGSSEFNSSRLRFASPTPHSPLLFEMLRIGGQVEAFLSLTRFRFSSHQAKIVLTIEDQIHEAIAPIYEGQMRVKLPSETTQILIQALQDGKKVAILIDSFEEVLDPSQFSHSFAKFLEEGTLFQPLLKGPI